jgi:hypothetical protein
MESGWVKKLVTVALLGVVIFGGIKWVGYLTTDSLRASDELARGVEKRK